MVLSAVPVSHAAPGDTVLTASAGTITGTSSGSLYHVPDPLPTISSETCVVSKIDLSAAATDLTSGIAKTSDYNVWFATSYPSVAQDVAALKAKFLTNSICEGNDFADTTCTSDAVSLSPGTYTFVIVNAQSSAVTVSSAKITECVTSGASRHLKQTFTFAALVVGALALV